jgi:hypothetical protein
MDLKGHVVLDVRVRSGSAQPKKSNSTHLWHLLLDESFVSGTLLNTAQNIQKDITLDGACR